MLGTRLQKYGRLMPVTENPEQFWKGLKLYVRIKKGLLRELIV
jgi:hypothetical protein